MMSWKDLEKKLKKIGRTFFQEKLIIFLKQIET